MEPKFTFRLDHARGLVRISMAGFYDIGDVAAFFDAQRTAHAELGLPPNQHLTLNDLRGMQVQKQEVIEAFRVGLAVPEERARKLAIVVDAAMARAQANRAIASADTHYFTDVAEAEAWLFADEEMVAVSRAAAAR
ncbi:hypothetical protein [Sphingosinicella sp.]|uniref:hypothetical protein n=1 Tax=Sphingosinicella sp. TaxID=1917971 RepID=UPI00403822EF